MKKALLILVIVTLTLLVLVGGGFAQKKPDVVGTWAGYAMVEGSQVDLTVVVEKGTTGYTGKISDATGMVPETPLKNIVFNDGKLSFEFDMVTESILIKIELTLENETLKGAWFDPDGNTDVIELTLKK
jgi:uncharacterized membrane protein